MEVPVQIDFQGMNPLERLRGVIAAQLTALEKRFGRITACRVVVKGPGGHHRTGGLYEINIHLALPSGREVDVARTATADERHADVDFAVNDAFKRARRRLQDQVRRMRGEVKSPERAPIGKITQFDAAGGFGFLESADGREIYFHRNSVLNADFRKLVPGARVAFAEEMGEKGPQASTVKLLGKHELR